MPGAAAAASTRSLHAVSVNVPQEELPQAIERVGLNADIVTVGAK
jgi:hypothetical protein